MALPCELRILNVTWAAKDTPLRVVLGASSIPLADAGPGCYAAETFAYPKVSPGKQGQLGVRQTQDSDQPPVIVLADGSEQRLVQVTGDDGQTWWIEKGKWHKDWQCHEAGSRNRPGNVLLRVGQFEITLQILTPGFSIDEFGVLLEEFRNGLWQLILDPKSPSTVRDQRADGGINDEYLAAVRDFAQHARRALERPHIELRERQTLQPADRVRPTTRTFQELALRGAPRLVTGRGHAPSFDTPENRQILAMATRLDRSVRALQGATDAYACDLERRAVEADGRAAALDGWVSVAPERLNQDIAEMKARLDAFRKSRNLLLTVRQPRCEYVSLRVKVTGDCEISNREYVRVWCIWLEDNNQPLPADQSLQLVFKAEISVVQQVLRKDTTLTLIGTFNYVDDRPKVHGGHWFRYFVLGLYQADSDYEFQVQRQLELLVNERLRLEQNGWRRKLDDKHRNEEQRDRQAHLLQSQSLRQLRDHWSSRSVALRSLTEQIAPVRRRADALGIAKTLNLAITGSMTYVQDPDYRGALAAFRRALAAANLDLAQLDRLLQMDGVGIIDLPKIYERWCLLRLLRVLTEEFRMVPEQGYRDDLQVRLIEQWSNTKPLQIWLRNADWNCSVLFEYEPEIHIEGKVRKPDFALTLQPGDGNSHYPPSNNGMREGDCVEAQRRGLTMDAKFHQFKPIASNEPGPDLADKLGELLGKGYDRDGSYRVFVLHPGRDGRSTSEWQRFCRYGGGHFTPDPESRPVWDQSEPDHRFGAVLLRPGAVDPLVRLIILHLYQNLSPHLEPNEPLVPSLQIVPFCPACRGHNFMEPSKKTQSSFGQVCRNVQCVHLVVRNHCWNCKTPHYKTPLFKLGAYWTFHDTSALNPYNIKCPHCGEYYPIDTEPLANEDYGPPPEYPF